MPQFIIAAGGAIETSVLPSHLLRLRARFCDVSLGVALSREATRFVTTAALQGISGRQVYTEDVCFDERTQLPMHIVFSMADLLVIYPCTARIIAECATGIVSCPVTRLFSFTKKNNIVLTPYLHPDMSESLYVDHVKVIENLGCTVIGPKSGRIQWENESAWMATEMAIVEKLQLKPRSSPASFRISSH